ncbi:MAG TPA: hypothetical protein VFC65_09865 [Prolixibacteraceae bacterium]|nr:hypothetical protein [Prolixibacteraceae bacterium]
MSVNHRCKPFMLSSVQTSQGEGTVSHVIFTGVITSVDKAAINNSLKKHETIEPT